MNNALKAATIVALLAVAFAAVWFSVSWRQHNPPCPSIAKVSASLGPNGDKAARREVPVNCLNFPPVFPPVSG